MTENIGKGVERLRFVRWREREEASSCPTGAIVEHKVHHHQGFSAGLGPLAL